MYQPQQPNNKSTLYWVIAILLAILAAVLITYFATIAATRYAPAYKSPPSGTNVCDGKKPKSGFDNFACAEDAVNEQAAADVSSPFIGTKETTAEPIMTAYWQAGICPVNVHWHLGAEHRSAGEYDEDGKGPAKARRAAGARQGLRCNKYNANDAKFTREYDWKHCKDMHVGETYEVGYVDSITLPLRCLSILLPPLTLPVHSRDFY